MKKSIKDMDDAELLDAWVRGCAWMRGQTLRTSETPVPLNMLNEPYNIANYTAGLQRIEKLEDELRRRKIKYGKN